MRPVRVSVTKASVNKKQRILFKPREWVEAAAQLGFTITATVLSISKQSFDIDFLSDLKPKRILTVKMPQSRGTNAGVRYQNFDCV